jgi:hypothetical protein
MELIMVLKVLDSINSVSDNLNNQQDKVSKYDDEYSIPLCIDDLIKICKEYSKLNWQMQSQIENILELGVEESIRTGVVPLSSLPYIKDFLIAISKNAYFGDASSQAEDCIKLICKYENNIIKSLLN